MSGVLQFSGLLFAHFGQHHQQLQQQQVVVGRCVLKLNLMDSGFREGPEPDESESCYRCIDSVGVSGGCMHCIVSHPHVWMHSQEGENKVAL